MELSHFWETASRSAIQEFSNTLWNPKVHYRVHKSLPLVPIRPIQPISLRARVSCNIILPPTSRSS
jgi:hypothetical protein